MRPSITNAANHTGNQRPSRHLPPLARLPIITRPITAETLESFLSRLANGNALSTTTWPLNQRKNPEFIAMLEQLTGHDRRRLVCALPELRTPTTLSEFPHLHQAASHRAGRRPACTYCAAAVARRRETATIFATHDQLICHRHQRWLGTSMLACTAAQQFSVRECPAIAQANKRHRRLIRQWGRTAVHWRFDDAVRAFHYWQGWPIVDNDPNIAHRRQALGINVKQPPISPHNVASWYPSAVELTSLMLSQDVAIKQTGKVTIEIIERGRDHIARHVVLDHRPEGAWDPYLRALRDRTPFSPTQEAGVPSEYSGFVASGWFAHPKKSEILPCCVRRGPV